jgi:hypothetical protein
VRANVATIDIEQVLELETAVWNALVDGDSKADARLLAADFVGVYPTGFADRSDHVGQIDAGRSVSSFELSEARFLEVSASAVLLSYRAEYRRAGETASDAELMYVSSLWCQRDGQWVNVFSQDTPAGDQPAV